MKRKVLIALSLTSALFLGACASQTTGNETIIELTETGTAKPQTVTVERGDLQVSASYDAQVGPRVVQLTFEEEGNFGEYKVGLGDTVKEGDVLAVPDTEQLEKDIEAKEQELSDLTFNYSYQKTSMENQIEILKYRMQDIYDQIEKEEYLTPKYTELCIKVGNYDQEKKRLELQLEQLQETYDLELPHCQSQLQKLREEGTGNTITAPFDGTIVALHEVEGSEFNTVAINTSLYYIAIADTSTLYARCEYVGQSVINSTEQIVFWKDGVEYNAGYIPMNSKIYRVMNNSGEEIYSEFALEYPDGEIASGDYGKIKLILKEKEQVLLLPENTILTDASGPYVYRDNDGVQERVSIEIGSTDGIRVEIVSGLEEGDVIYVQE